MRRIFKYPLNRTIGEVQTIALPDEARVIAFRMQDSIPVIWALVNQIITEHRKFILYYTGDTTDLRERANKYNMEMLGTEVYIGTDMDSIGLVYHLFEVID